MTETGAQNPSKPALETVVTREVRPAKQAERTIYDAGGVEIFFKNFLSGFAHALGMIVVYLIFLSGMALLFLRFALPVIQPYLDMYKQSMSSLQMLQQFSTGGVGATEPAVQGTGTYPDSTGQTSPELQQLQGRFSPAEMQQAEQLLQQMQQKQN